MNSKAKSQRLDLLLVERKLVESREKAKRLIMAGEVLVQEEVYDKPGRLVPLDASIRLRTTLKYVSRGGLKLEKSLQEFQIDVADKIAVDIGASTGGFTDCLLQLNAKQVFAIDVGYGQLAWKLRSDDRVVTVERTNIRYLEALPGTPAPLADLAVIDVSFISLSLVMPAVLNLLRADDVDIIVLIKPQFEAGKDHVGHGGVVRNPKTHRRVIQSVFDDLPELGLRAVGLTASPITGPAGNVEFLAHLKRNSTQSSTFTDLHTESIREDAIDRALEQAQALRKPE